jgi:exopolysaccharide biosynthesis polyprenyl glycosylphosphotransferase
VSSTTHRAASVALPQAALSGEDARDVAALRRTLERRGRIGQLSFVTADAVVLAVLISVAHTVLGIGGAGGTGSLGLGALGIVCSVALLHVYGLYPRAPQRLATGTLDDLPALFHAIVPGMLVTAGLLSLGDGHVGLPDVLIMIAAALALLTMARVFVRFAVARWRAPTRVLAVGSNANSPIVLGYLLARRDVEIVGHMRTSQRHDSGTDDLPVLRGPDDLRRVLVAKKVERIVLFGDDGATELPPLARQARLVGANLTVVPEHLSMVGAGAAVDQLLSVTAFSMRAPTLSGTARVLKRGLDVIVSLAGLVMLTPLLLSIAVAVRIDSRGPVLFRQKRVGRHGKPFDVLKFRTMVSNADDLTAELMKQSKDPNWLLLDHDPRITRLGRTLRTTSLDELPQLWNVLRGEMSLVGPRPLSLRDDTRVDGWGRTRLDLTPGITGLWQVLGRTSIPFEEMVKLDYLYVSNWSLWTDVKLLLRTLPAVVAQRGSN